MGKTVFNPITTKWRGAIGGFRYSVVRGNQVIAERASAVKNPRTKAQMDTRAKFKLASQFSNLWSDLINLYLVKKEHDKVLTRSMATKVAFFGATKTENNYQILLPDFANDMNAYTNQPVKAGLNVVFTSSTQSITAANKDIVNYKVVAFDEQNTPIGSNVVTYVSDGSAKTIDLPAIFGNATRYDLLVFVTTPVEGAEEYTGRISSMQGMDNLNDVYQVYTQAVADSMLEISGLYASSYYVS